MPDTQSSLEVIKVTASIATPIIITMFGFALNRSLKKIDQSQWQNRKIVEKRLELYDMIAPDLNSTFCFVMWVGDWKEISPDDMIIIKRRMDRNVNIYKHLISDEFYKAYDKYIHYIFKTYTGRGESAKLRAATASNDGDRKEQANYKWNDQWNSYFITEEKIEKEKLKNLYEDVMSAITKCIFQQK